MKSKNKKSALRSAASADRDKGGFFDGGLEKGIRLHPIKKVLSMKIAENFIFSYSLDRGNRNRLSCLAEDRKLETE
ncbi:hypothetical protein CLOLEP_00842 [[Clostridium] leptum DSM 753]|uniref:Uncharacterized protein n=1 Tax=[Clostridium] leptum DSM 753 TaxID=428125 RepID=A7VQL2_9FIRM|nr:hypothetical protein CLOLEP_00842 [[Clostridium] leptum DSM 753]MCC3319641.1 hypothetical protein [[Clostridium] innocuum]